MTADEFRAIRKRHRLTCAGLATILRIDDQRTIRRYEQASDMAGSRAVSGPVSLLMEMLDGGVFKP
jgi:predicted transcriptional regulator